MQYSFHGIHDSDGEKCVVSHTVWRESEQAALEYLINRWPGVTFMGVSCQDEIRLLRIENMLLKGSLFR